MSALIGKFKCWRGWHDWDKSSDEIGETTIFYRISCMRPGCKESVDGTIVREAKRILGKNHWAVKKLP